MIRSSKKVFVAPIPSPDLDLDASFSFGSDTEEESPVVDETKSRLRPKSNSFRLNIRKGSRKENDRKEPRTLMSLKEKEKESLSRAERAIRALRGEDFSRESIERDLREIMKSGGIESYSKSWRANNIIVDAKGVEVTENGYVESILSALNLTTSFDNVLTDAERDKYYVQESPTMSVTAHSKPKISEKTLRSNFQTCLDAINAEKWHALLRNVSIVPGLIAYQSTSHEKKNLLHVLAGSKAGVPSAVFQVLVDESPEALKQLDRHFCTPLHYAVSIGRDENAAKIFLKKWPEGASQRNVDGDLPLHVAVWAGMGNENITKDLLNVHPAALIIGNDVGGTPLHLACCGAGASPPIVRLLLKKHEEREYPIQSLDCKGNAPVHIAVKTKAPLEVLQAFHEVYKEYPFAIKGSDGKYPLQIVMGMKNIDVNAAYFLASVAPKTAKIPMASGIMPAVHAASKGMPYNLVKQLLLADMPINFAPRERKEIIDVILRTHSYSWWHLAINHGRYARVFHEILAQHANILEIVSLAQETDPDGYSCLIERSHIGIQRAFKNNLVFEQRYHIVPTFRALIHDNTLKVCAVDMGERIGWEEMSGNPNSPLFLDTGYTSVAPEQSGTEVVFYSKPQREVVLHMCLKGSKAYNGVLKEIETRKNFNFSHLDTQRLYNVHTFDARPIGCAGEMLCLSFERPLLTLADVFETSRFRKRKNQAWARKTVNLLKRLGEVLKYFHSAGYVHGYVESSTVAKFEGSNNWKLTDLQLSTKIGSRMKGWLRLGAPPESVTSLSLVRNDSLDMTKSISFDEAFSKTKKINYCVYPEEERPDLKFTPEEVIADPSWDIFSFGLIMGQLILGQSMVLLPNFERAPDAHMKNLIEYNYDSLDKIVAAARRVSGNQAAELLKKCLQPFPEERPETMDEILRHRYFTYHF